MSVVTKLSSYGVALIASFALALMLLGGVSERAEAAAGTVTLGSATIPANNSTQTVIVTDADILAGTFIIASIDPSSTGTAKFTSSGGQSIVCIDATACDTGGAAGAITIGITGTGTAGTVVVNVRLVDAADGLDGLGDDSDIVTIAYTQTAVATTVSLYAGNAATGANAHNTAITATPATTADQIVLAARVTTGSGTTTAIVPAAGNALTITALPGASGVFADTVAAAATMPTAWETAAGVGVTAFDAGGAALSGCATGEGSQTCTATTDTTDDGATGESSATAAVLFEGGGVAGTADIRASFGSLNSNIVSVTLFGTAAAASVDLAPASVARISTAAGSATSVRITVTDANNFPVAGHVPGVTVSDPTTGKIGVGAVAATNGAGQTTVVLTVPAGGLASGNQTIDVTLAGSTTVQDSITIELVSAPATIAIVTAPDAVDALETFDVVTRLETADGVAVLNGTLVAVAATGAGVLLPGQTLATVDGNVTISFVAEDQAGQIQVVIADAATGSLLATTNVTVNKAAPPATGGFDRAIADTGINTAVWLGGTLADLSTATADAGGTSVTVFTGGAPVVHIPGAPDFVNAAFSAAFPDGTVANGTIVLVAVIP